jgi:hypothetical protein
MLEGRRAPGSFGLLEKLLFEGQGSPGLATHQSWEFASDPQEDRVPCPVWCVRGWPGKLPARFPEGFTYRMNLLRSSSWMSFLRRSSTYSRVITTRVGAISEAWKLTSSRTRSMIVANLRAPMFWVVWLTR